MNDAIDPNLCSMTYASVDEVAMMIAALRRGSYLEKVDIKACSGMDGLRTAAKIFTVIAAALMNGIANMEESGRSVTTWTIA